MFHDVIAKYTEGFSRYRNQIFTSIDAGICWRFSCLVDLNYHYFGVYDIIIN